MRTSWNLFALITLSLNSVWSVGCGEPELSEDPAIASVARAALSDVLRFESRTDGLYDVYCKDGRIERGVPLTKLTSGDVCNPVVADDLGCTGDFLRSADVISRFTAGTTSAELGMYQLKGRSRICTAATGCSAWAEDSAAIPQGAAVGRTQINVVDTAGNVAVTFEQLPTAKAWLSNVALGGTLDGTALGTLLGSPTGWTFQASPIRKDCAAIKAVKKESVDALRTKETEVVLRATHSLGGAVSPYFTSSRPISFDCAVHRWDYAWTCTGYHETNEMTKAEGTLKLGTGGRDITYAGTSGMAKYTSDWNKTHAVDSRGMADYASGDSRFHANVTGSGVLVELSYSWTSTPNWCGASTHIDFRCTGVLLAP